MVDCEIREKSGGYFMIFVILVLYGIVAGFFISKRKMKISQAVIPMIAFAILSCVVFGSQSYSEFNFRS